MACITERGIAATLAERIWTLEQGISQQQRTSLQPNGGAGTLETTLLARKGEVWIVVDLLNVAHMVNMELTRLRHTRRVER